jgi:hypothetical protein
LVILPAKDGKEESAYLLYVVRGPLGKELQIGKPRNSVLS